MASFSAPYLGFALALHHSEHRFVVLEKVLQPARFTVGQLAHVVGDRRVGFISEDLEQRDGVSCQPVRHADAEKPFHRRIVGEIHVIDLSSGRSGQLPRHLVEGERFGARQRAGLALVPLLGEGARRRPLPRPADRSWESSRLPQNQRSCRQSGSIPPLRTDQTCSCAAGESSPEAPTLKMLFDPPCQSQKSSRDPIAAPRADSFTTCFYPRLYSRNDHVRLEMFHLARVVRAREEQQLRVFQCDLDRLAIGEVADEEFGISYEEGSSLFGSRTKARTGASRRRSSTTTPGPMFPVAPVTSTVTVAHRSFPSRLCWSGYSLAC